MKKAGELIYYLNIRHNFAVVTIVAAGAVVAIFALVAISATKAFTTFSAIVAIDALIAIGAKISVNRKIAFTIGINKIQSGSQITETRITLNVIRCNQ